MTAPMLARPIGVRTADLRDARDRARIDGFVREAEGATPFHLAGWTDAVARGTGQRGHYLVAEHGDGALVGVLPLTAMRSRLFGRALVSAGFAVGGGILAETPGAADALASGAWALAERLGCPSVELRGGPAPEGWSMDNTTYCGFVRALAADDAAELVAVPRKQRAEVRKALDLPLEVVVGSDRRALAEHYAVYAESVRNLGTPVFPARLMREVAGAFGADADVLTVRHEGRAVASVLSVYFGGTVFPYWGGGTHAARGLRANDRMYFALMAHARARGCARFDFGRSKVGTGAAAFKKNWGFAPEPLPYAKRAADGAGLRAVNPLDPRYAARIAAWRKLPLPIANMLGPWISRGLG
ncbi:MAG: FemAB family XrtA/PEP-CTERM system-associated protein [Janthinobacterium lividum]